MTDPVWPVMVLISVGLLGVMLLVARVGSRG